MFQRGHRAASGRQGEPQPHVADDEVAAEPGVLHERRPVDVEHQVGAVAQRLHPEVVHRRRGDQVHREWSTKLPPGVPCAISRVGAATSASTPCSRTSSGSGRSTSAPAGRVALRCTARPSRAPSRASTSGSSASTAVPSGSVIRTAGPPVARHRSRSRQSRGCFAVATRPVAVSISASARSPTTPPGSSVSRARSSPSIDLTGWRRSAVIVAIRAGPARSATPRRRCPGWAGRRRRAGR